MATIQPNVQGKLEQAKKRLKRRIAQLNGAGSLTAGQRDILFADVLVDLCRIQLAQLGRIEDIE